MSNPFDGIFDKIDIPVATSDAPETLPIYTDGNVAGAAVPRPATPREQAIESQLGLTLKQQNNICVLARDLYINGKLIDARSVLNIWPTFEATQDSRLMIMAGPPPKIKEVNDYMVTDAFRTGLARIGVYIGVHALNTKQLAFLSMVGDTSNKSTIGGIKRKLGITAVEYTSWLAQPEFQEAFVKNGNKLIREAIPLAKARIARKMEDGDLAFIKYGFEVSGEYNPNDRKQVDAQALIRVIFEVLEEEIKDPSVLKRIGAKVQLRGSGGNVVQGSIED